MTVFSSSMNHRSYYWQITAVCFVLGLILAAAWHTVSQVTRAGDGPHREGFFFGNGANVSAKKLKDDQDEINHLRRQNQDLNDQISRRTGAASALNRQLKDAEIFAGLTEVAGPGVRITLTDSARRDTVPSDPLSLNNLIHDVDIAQVVNELKIAGSEAIAVNGQRIVASSTIRCVGPVIQINGVPAAPPYIIDAIGDQNAMYGGVNMQSGVLDQMRRQDMNMVRVDRKPELNLPAYAGSTRMRYAHTPKTSKDDASKDNS